MTDETPEKYEYPENCPACGYDGLVAPRALSEAYLPVDDSAEEVEYAKRCAEVLKTWCPRDSEPKWIDWGEAWCDNCGVNPRDFEIAKLKAKIAELEKQMEAVRLITAVGATLSNCHTCEKAFQTLGNPTVAAPMAKDKP